jgi:hypothetical protein
MKLTRHGPGFGRTPESSYLESGDLVDAISPDDLAALVRELRADERLPAGATAAIRLAAVAKARSQPVAAAGAQIA